MSCGDTVPPVPLEVKIATLKTKPLPIARNYGTPVPPNARRFQNGVGDSETPCFMAWPHALVVLT